ATGQQVLPGDGQLGPALRTKVERRRLSLRQGGQRLRTSASTASSAFCRAARAFERCFFVALTDPHDPHVVKRQQKQCGGERVPGPQAAEEDRRQEQAEWGQ